MIIDQLYEFAPSGDDGQGPDQEELLRRLAVHWWNGNDRQMARVEHTLAAMGWEIGQDEGYDDGGVFVVRAGDEHGRTYTSWSAEELDMNEAAPPGARAERMVRHIKQGYAKDGKLTPREKGIAFATAWKAHNAGRVEEGEITKNATGLKHRATDKYGAGDDEPHHYTGGRSGFSEPGKYARDLEHVNKQLVKDLDASMGISWKNRGTKGIEVDEQGVTEAAQGHTIEAHGVRGMDRRTWHKTFRNTDQMIAWAEKHDAEIIGTRDLEQARHHNLSPANKGVTEGFFDQFRKKQQNYGGIDVSVEKEDNNILVKATANGRELGRVLFTPSEQDDNLLVPLDLEVDERYRGQGIGATMYDYVKSLGYTIRRSQYQTDAGAGFWDKHKSGKNVWEQGVAEGLTEMDKSEPSAGRDGSPRPGPDREAKPISAKKATKDAGRMLNRAFQDSHKKKDVKEGEIEQTKTGIRHRGDRYGSGEELPNGGGNRSGFPNPGKYARDLDHLDKNLTSKLDHSMGVTWPHGNKKRDMDESIDPLMMKLKRAMVREGRVKELADDLKTMPDADFMKKYGKVKAAIRKDMKRVDEATPAMPAAPVNEQAAMPPDQAARLAPYLQKDANGSQYYNLPTTNPGETGAAMGQTNISPTALAQIKSPQGQQKIIQQLLAMTEPKNAVPQSTTTATDVSDQYAGGLNELSTNKLAQYKTAAARDAKRADQAGDFKRGDKRLSGMVQATKKQFDNDAKKVDESRAARQALMAQIVNGN